MRVGKVRASDPIHREGPWFEPKRRSKATQMRGFFYFLTFLSFISWGILFISSILESIDKYYVGKTKSVQNRLKFHNSKLNKIWSKRQTLDS